MKLLAAIIVLFAACVVLAIGTKLKTHKGNNRPRWTQHNVKTMPKQLRT